jgi:hypothetical protein
MISEDSWFVKNLFAAAAIARRKDRAAPRVTPQLPDLLVSCFLPENPTPFLHAPRPAQDSLASYGAPKALVGCLARDVHKAAFMP